MAPKQKLKTYVLGGIRAVAAFALAAALAACSADATGPQHTETELVPVASEPEKDRPPEIAEIRGQENAVVGIPVSLEAIVMPTNHDAFEVSWSQVTNPDKYAGTNFLSSSQVELEQNGSLVSFTPKWPGKYRLKVTASDKDGESGKTIDVIVMFDKPPFNMRGIVQNWWGPPGNNDEKSAIPNIDRAKELGANYIQFIPTYYQTTPRDNEMKPCSEFEESAYRWCTPLPDSKLREWIRHAKSRDMGVLLKIVVDSTNASTTGHSIINPANPDKWFESYSEYVIKYATLAQEESVEWISIGNELSQVQPLTPYWSRLIDSVKNVYGGKLTYSDNRIVLHNTMRYAQFWNKLDALSENMFYAGSDKNNNPGVEEMQRYILAQMRGDLSGESRKYGRGIIGTEVGKPDYDGTNYDFTTASGRVPDTQEQADWLEAMLRALYTLKQVDGINVEGMFMWNMHIRPPSTRIGTGTRDFRERPAEELIKLWYGGK